MRSRQSLASVVMPVLLCVSPAATRAAEVLKHVPSDALGFVVVKNLGATDAKIERMLTTLQTEFPGPLAFLQAATGVSDGLDPNGDFLLAALPDAADGKPQFAVWLPVRDFNRLIASLGGVPGQQIVGATVAGEDVLIAHHERWALVMDPDQRERLEKMLAGAPGAATLALVPPPAIAAWNDWIDANDITVVALPNGIRATLAWAAAGRSAAQSNPAHNADDDVFNFGAAGDSNDPFAASPDTSRPTKVDATLRSTILKWATASPQLTGAILRARLLGCALRLDDDGNLQARFRVNGVDEKSWGAKDSDDIRPLPFALYQGGDFVLHGGGHLPPPLASIAAGAYVRALIEELKAEEGMVFRDVIVRQFQQAVERTAAQVQSVVVLTQPGDKPVGVYTNDFLVVRAASAKAFADKAQDVMRLWNTMNRDAQAETRLIFDVANEKFGDREATQYSLDIAAADGAPDLPEIRQAMEQLFGPGGKLRLWIVPVDDRNALLASGTPEQVAAALEVLDRKQSIDWSHGELAAVNRLLSQEADWRLFFSPHHYNTWRRRQMHAITGPVLGGPLVKEFPPAPPIGLTGGLRSGELWINAVVPTETLKGTGAYLKR